MPLLATPFLRNHKIRDGIGKAIYDAMERDPSIHLFGEGAMVKVHYDAPDIERDFPTRVHTMPISEDGNTSFCVGASLLGVKPIVDVITADFLYRTMDSICNTAAKLDFVTGQGHTIVVRAEFLTAGPCTGQRPEALFTHIPGLRVVIPSTPHDAYGLMRTALLTPGVTLFFEDRMIADDGDWLEGDLELRGTVPFGRAVQRRGGKKSQVTILTYGVMRQVVERALGDLKFDSDYLPGNGGVLCDVVDLCSLYPLDWAFIKRMLGLTRRLLVVEPDIAYGGIGAEIVARIAEDMPQVRVRRLGAPHSTIPASTSLHGQMLPNEERILDAITSLVKEY